ncbi:MAG: hypothetical protein NPIRA05_04500 [Nitrospirales bacterium]|nr:MAG: hypothetical protein NPIRA05_04500 [Nitrospirales bacterium]
MRNIILFELNEVPFAVIDHFCHTYPQSHLAKILPYCAQYETYTEDKGELHPWATWPTLHRGVSNQQHQIKDLGQNLTQIDKDYPPVWKILHHHNISTGVFASMNSYPLPESYEHYAFYVPDPFAPASEAYPDYVVPFQTFNLAMSRKSELNVNSGFDIQATVSLLSRVPRLGITGTTLISVLRQLMEERMNPHVRTRRRTYQSVLAFDVYMKLLRTRRPAFSTYFSNHVASTMHRYWGATFPDDYEINNLPQQWIQTFRYEIDFAMKKFDGFFQRLTAFADANPAYKVLVASSMGQKGTIAELVKTRTCVNDIQKLMSRFGLKTGEWAVRPAMHPQCNVVVQKNKVQEFTRKIQTCVIHGGPLRYRTKENGFFSLDFGHVNLPVDYAVFNNETTSFEELGLINDPVDDESFGTAYHRPEGSLFIYDPLDTATVKDRKRQWSTLAITPSILENFGVCVPSYMVQRRVLEIAG